MDMLGWGNKEETTDSVAAKTTAASAPPPPRALAENDSRAGAVSGAGNTTGRNGGNANRNALSQGEAVKGASGQNEMLQHNLHEAQQQGMAGKEERSTLETAAQAQERRPSQKQPSEIQPGDVVVALHNFAGDDEGELPMKKGQKVSSHGDKEGADIRDGEQRELILRSSHRLPDSSSVHGRRGLVARREQRANGPLPFQLRQAYPKRGSLKPTRKQ